MNDDDLKAEFNPRKYVVGSADAIKDCQKAIEWADEALLPLDYNGNAMTNEEPRCDLELALVYQLYAEVR